MALSAVSLLFALPLVGMLSDALRVTSKAGKQNVLILGCSLDRFAVSDWCRDGGADVTLDDEHVFDEAARSCSRGEHTLAYMFIPGSGPPPYFAAFGKNYHRFGLASDVQSIVAFNSTNFSQRVFQGSSPQWIVVDASIWDLSKFWQYGGFGDEQLHKWCEEDIPTLLSLVEKTYPQSRVAFRTGPTVDREGAGQSKENIEKMRECILRHKDADTNLVYGKYSLIDYHRIVDLLVDTRDAQSLWRDARHPSCEASLLYVDQILALTGEHRGGDHAHCKNS